MKKSFLFLFLICPLFAFSAGTWTKQSSGLTTHLLGVYTVDAKSAFAVGSGGKMIHTVDGGNKWSTVNCGATTDLYNIHFTDTNNGYATGNEAIRTKDGGKTWSKMHVSSIPGILFRDLYWLTDSIGYIGATKWASEGFLFKTLDGGTTWTEIDLPASKGIYGVTFTDKNNGYLATYGGELLETTDGGKSWTLRNLTSKIFGHIYSFDKNNLLIAGRLGAHFSSNNAGTNWTDRYTDKTDLGRYGFANANFGINAGGSIANNTGLILTTNDAGKTWTSYDPKTPRLTSASFYSGNSSSNKTSLSISTIVGYAVGLDGTILKYTDKTVGVEEIEKTKINITIYPNPAKEIITLDFDSKLAFNTIELRIMDAQGRLVKELSAEIRKEILLDINSLSSGNYFITISSGSRVLDIKQFIVVH